MRPRLISRGNPAWPSTPDAKLKASMRPRLISRGNGVMTACGNAATALQ